jgi:hypothetical protein
MSHFFSRLGCPIVLETGDIGWLWVEAETDDFSGKVQMMKPQLLLSLPDRDGLSRLGFVIDEH